MSILNLQNNMIRKSIKSFLIVLITTLTTYFGYADAIDPAFVLSYTDPVKDEIISEIENESSEKIYLKAGNEKFGFSHILKRHSGTYFKDNEQKGNLFPTGTTGKQIIKGIKSAAASTEMPFLPRLLITDKPSSLLPVTITFVFSIFRL